MSIFTDPAIVLSGDLYLYQAFYLDHYDADTVDLRVDVGFRHFMEDRFRLWGINAYEVRGAERQRGLDAKVFAATWLEPHAELPMFIRTYKSDKRGKYGRWLAELFVADPGGEWHNLNQLLVDASHAVVATYD